METSSPLVLVYASLDMEGFHCWPEAPETVSFLRDRHRHVFKIKVCSKVEHNDRDVEFILLGRYARLALESAFGKPCEFGSMSCETIAAHLMEALELYSCEVSEDGENGAIIIRE